MPECWTGAYKQEEKEIEIPTHNRVLKHQTTLENIPFTPIIQFFSERGVKRRWLPLIALRDII